MNMQYINLGDSDLKVSALSFGCWSLGGHGAGNDYTSQSQAAVSQAIEMGINLFDTAGIYGFGQSEIVLSQALGSKRHDVVIATKYGVHWDQQRNIYRDLDPKKIMPSLEDSLRRLRLDCIKLYQIHWPDGKTSIDHVMEVLLKAKDAGKILHIGFSNFSQKDLTEVNIKQHVVSFQCQYNFTERKKQEEMRYCHEKLGLSVIIYGVIGRGVFSGKKYSTQELSQNDTRRKDPNFMGEMYARNRKIALGLKELGGRIGKTPTQMAIRWALENPDVSTVLVGMNRPEQVAENAGALGWRMDAAHLAEIDRILGVGQDEHSKQTSTL